VKRILVSIVIPVYNKEKHLDNCLESILSQTYKNIEIIIINDGSKDKSDKIIRRWLSKDSRIRYYTQTNQGVASARNKGISLARGDFIYFLDADDVVKKDAIKKLITNAIETNADLIVANFSTKRGEGYFKNKSFKESILRKKDLKTTEVKADMFFINGRSLSSVCNKLFKRSFLLKTNIKFEDKVFAEDRLFNLKQYINFPVISIINEYTYIYNVVKDSRSRTINNNFYNEYILLFHSFYNYLEEKEMFLENQDLAQFTILYDMEKIFDYIYDNSNKKIKDINSIVKLLKKDKKIVKVIRSFVKQKPLKRLRGRRSYLLRVNVFYTILLYAPRFIFSFNYVLYRIFMYLARKTKVI